MCGAQARAAAEAAAAAAAADEAEAPVHEENDWGIEVVPADGESAGGSGGGNGRSRGAAEAGARTGPGEPAEGLQYSMPVRHLSSEFPCVTSRFANRCCLPAQVRICAALHHPALTAVVICALEALARKQPCVCQAVAYACARRREWMQRSCARGR